MSHTQTTVRVRCDPQLIDRVDVVAEAYGLSREEAVRQLVEAGLDEVGR